MKSIKNVSKFARAQDELHQTIFKRIKAGWVIGIVNGKKCMFNPANVHEVKESSDD